MCNIQSSFDYAIYSIPKRSINYYENILYSIQAFLTMVYLQYSIVGPPWRDAGSAPLAPIPLPKQPALATPSRATYKVKISAKIWLINWQKKWLISLKTYWFLIILIIIGLCTPQNGTNAVFGAQRETWSTMNMVIFDITNTIYNINRFVNYLDLFTSFKVLFRNKWF